MRNRTAAAPEWDDVREDVVGVLARLTAQEQACLRLVAQRMSSKEIAAELGIAKTSVDTYCNRARQKLGVSDRYAAARMLTAEVAAPAPKAAPEAAVAQSPLPARQVIGWAAIGLAAAAVGVASLLAGMAALEELKPPNRARPPVSTPAPGSRLADAHGG